MTTFLGRLLFDTRRRHNRHQNTNKSSSSHIWQAKAMAKDIETHIYAHTGVDELDEAKIESELNYEHYKVPSRGY